MFTINSWTRTQTMGTIRSLNKRFQESQKENELYLKYFSVRITYCNTLIDYEFFFLEDISTIELSTLIIQVEINCMCGYHRTVIACIFVCSSQSFFACSNFDWKRFSVPTKYHWWFCMKKKSDTLVWILCKGNWLVKNLVLWSYF